VTELTFSQLGLPETLLAGVEALGYEAPSAIQAAAIPPAMAGRDIIGLSETGSGKTAAFGLAGLSRVDCGLAETQLLVVCPTRELAVQVCGEIQRLAAKLPGLHATAIYGGAPMDRQVRALRNGAQVVVGTPGRLIDHVERGTIDLSHVRTIVLDEADRMLDMGFVDDMEAILRTLPEDRQTLFFSATMNSAVQRLIARFGKEPELVQIERKTLTVESIEQVCFEARQRSRIELVSRIIDLEQPKLTMIFCNTKRAVDECTEALLSRGYSADRLHGDIAQTMRERVLRLFREGTVEILVATDVAARGIDVDDVDIVINYELPQDPEDYVHRVGRTGRAGRSGKAVSFIHGRDAYRIRTIERFIRQAIPKGSIPSQEEVNTHLADQLIASVADRLESRSETGLADPADSDEPGPEPEAEAEPETDAALTASLLPLREAGHEWESIAGALMGLLREMTAREGEEIDEDRPRSGRRDDHDRREPRRDFDPDAARDRPARPRREHPSGTEAGMVSLFLSLGKRDSISPGDIVGMLHNECGLEPGSVGRIKLMPAFSIVEVREESARKAIDMAPRCRLRGREFRLDYDRGSGGGGGDRDEARPKGPRGPGAPWQSRGDRGGHKGPGGYGKGAPGKPRRDRDRY